MHGRRHAKHARELCREGGDLLLRSRHLTHELAKRRLFACSCALRPSAICVCSVLLTARRRVSTGSRDFVVDAIEAAACWLCESCCPCGHVPGRRCRQSAYSCCLHRASPTPGRKGGESSPPPNEIQPRGRCARLLGVKARRVSAVRARARARGARRALRLARARGVRELFWCRLGHRTRAPVSAARATALAAVRRTAASRGIGFVARPTQVHAHASETQAPKASAGSVDSAQRGRTRRRRRAGREAGACWCACHQSSQPSPRKRSSAPGARGGSGTLSVAGPTVEGVMTGAPVQIESHRKHGRAVTWHRGRWHFGHGRGRGRRFRVGSGTDNPANASPTDIPPTGSGVGTASGRGRCGCARAPAEGGKLASAGGGLGTGAQQTHRRLRRWSARAGGGERERESQNPRMRGERESERERRGARARVLICRARDTNSLSESFASLSTSAICQIWPSAPRVQPRLGEQRHRPHLDEPVAVRVHRGEQAPITLVLGCV